MLVWSLACKVFPFLKDSTLTVGSSTVADIGDHLNFVRSNELVAEDVHSLRGSYLGRSNLPLP